MRGTEEPSGDVYKGERLPLVESIQAASVHAQQILFSIHYWVERADVKASILLASVTAAIGAVAAAMFTTADWASQNVWPRASVEGLLFLAIAGLLAAGVLAGLSIYPRLGAPYRRQPGSIAPGDLVYFGRLRSIPPPEIAEAIRKAVEDDTIVEHYAEQIQTNAQVAWRKHRMLQRSLKMVLVASGFGMAGLATWVVMRLAG